MESFSTTPTTIFKSGVFKSGKDGCHIVRAHLPNNQTTAANIPAGMTVREALDRAMRHRKLDPDMCYVYRVKKETQNQEDNKCRIDWDVDVSMLKGDEIVVETKNEYPMHTQISHNFSTKQFFTLAECDFCRSFLIWGIRCLTCGIRFHSRCSNSIPSLCQPYKGIEENTYYKHLLARDPRNGESATIRQLAAREQQQNQHNHNNNNHQNGLKSKFRRSGNQASLSRERSTSAPNVVYNLVKQENCFSMSPNPYLNPNDCTHQNGYNEFSLSVGYPYAYKCGTNHESGYNNPIIGVPAHGSTSSGAGYSPTRTQSAAGSPTNPNRPSRPRARSADESFKKAKEKDAVNGASGNNPNAESGREPHEEWEIPGNQIKQGSRIGSGSFGTVFKGTWYGPVALKKLNVVDPTPVQLQAFKNEVAMLKKTRHVNIILFMGCVSKPQLTIVTQWCQGSSLYKHLHVFETKYVPLQMIEIARETAQGMDYLHAKNIIHRDLKSNSKYLTSPT